MADMDLRAVDLNLLVAFERLLARGSVTGAARDLGITQPAMSRTLARLRELFGDPLLVKVGRGLVPTDRARELEGEVAEALAAVRRALRPPERFDPATARGTLTLALGDEAQASFADAIGVALWAVAPGVDLRVRPLSMATLDEARRGEVDLALAPDLAGLPPRAGGVDLSEWVTRRLYTRRFVVARAEGRAAPADLDAYCAAGHVIVGWDGGGRGFVDDLLERLGRRRRVAATVTSFHSAARLVAGTDLLATLPAEVLATSGAAVRASEVPFVLPSVPMLLVWHPRRTTDPRHRFLRERVAAAVAERAGGLEAG